MALPGSMVPGTFKFGRKMVLNALAGAHVDPSGATDYAPS